MAILLAGGLRARLLAALAAAVGAVVRVLAADALAAAKTAPDKAVADRVRLEDVGRPSVERHLLLAREDVQHLADHAAEEAPPNGRPRP